MPDGAGETAHLGILRPDRLSGIALWRYVANFMACRRVTKLGPAAAQHQQRPRLLSSDRAGCHAWSYGPNPLYRRRSAGGLRQRNTNALDGLTDLGTGWAGTTSLGRGCRGSGSRSNRAEHRAEGGSDVNKDKVQADCGDVGVV